MPDTDLGARLYLALSRHDLLATYREHGGAEGGTADGPICVLEPRSLGALVRVLPGVSISTWTDTMWRAESYGHPSIITKQPPEQAVARALLLALGEEE